jgi:hypothetical protein
MSMTRPGTQSVSSRSRSACSIPRLLRAGRSCSLSGSRATSPSTHEASPNLREPARREPRPTTAMPGR